MWFPIFASVLIFLNITILLLRSTHARLRLLMDFSWLQNATFLCIAAPGVVFKTVNRVWDAELESLLDRAKIVLNLRTWGTQGEWKATRLSQLLANGR